MNAIDVISTFVIILINGVLAVISARITRLPVTLCILFWGILSAVLVPISGFDTGIRAANFQTLIMYVLIPVLVFEAAMSIKLRILKPVVASILFASTVGIVISTLIAAAILFYAINHPGGFPWIAALIAGLVISATDPVAVVEKLKHTQAPETLGTVIEGESLFNDASAIVLFSLLLAVALGHSAPSLSSGFIELVRVLVGGILVGGLLAVLCRLLLKVLPQNGLYYVLLSLTAAYGSFLVAEHLLHVSGVVCVLSCALFSKNAFLEHKSCHTQMHESWAFFSFLANLIVFYMMGLVFTFSMFTDQWLAMVFGVLAAFVSRLVSSYITLAVGIWGFKDKLSWHYGPLMVWGGLRGVVTLALVLSLPVELEYWWTIQSIGFGVVLFTLVVQATTTQWLIKKLP